MQHAHGMEVPDSVAEMCRSDRTAVLVYDAALSATDRQNIENYLSAKYALT